MTKKKWTPKKKGRVSASGRDRLSSGELARRGRLIAVEQQLAKLEIVLDIVLEKLAERSEDASSLPRSDDAGEE